jgi:predicted small secreted protein
MKVMVIVIVMVTMMSTGGDNCNGGDGDDDDDGDGGAKSFLIASFITSGCNTDSHLSRRARCTGSVCYTK